MNKSRIRKPAAQVYDIEIPLRERPRKYKRGSGPALGKIDIVLRNDSTAYITDREVLRLHTRDGHVRLQLHYIVRWEDLPSASVAIPADSICYYVSPRVLEDFEYERSLEQDRLDEEARLRKEAEEKRKAPLEVLPGVPNGTGKAAEKRGPLSRVDLVSRQPSNTTSEDELALPVTSLCGPSLSTPKKRKRVRGERFTDLDEDTEDVDPEDAILEQLHGENSKMKIRVDNSAGKAVQTVPTTSLNRPHLLAESSSSSSNHSTTPIPVPKRVAAGSKPAVKPFADQRSSPRISRTPIPVPKHPLQSAVSTTNFTPAGRSTGSWAVSQTPIQAAVKAEAQAVQSPAKSADNKKKKTPKASKSADAEPEYVIKKLENYRVIEEDDGTQWRQWRVRWEGDWPPDLNPTWEPESFLPKSLVRQCLKKAAKSSTNATTSDVIHVERASGPLKRKYSSVAEAFEGEAEEQTNRNRGNTAESEDDEDRLVVDEDEEEGRNREQSPQHIPIRDRGNLDFAHARTLYGELDGRNGDKAA